MIRTSVKDTKQETNENINIFNCELGGSNNRVNLSAKYS